MLTTENNQKSKLNEMFVLGINKKKFNIKVVFYSLNLNLLHVFMMKNNDLLFI